MRAEHDAKSHDFIILNIVCKINKSKILNITYTNKGKIVDYILAQEKYNTKQDLVGRMMLWFWFDHVNQKKHIQQHAVIEEWDISTWHVSETRLCYKWSNESRSRKQATWLRYFKYENVEKAISKPRLPTQVLRSTQTRVIELQI